MAWDLLPLYTRVIAPLTSCEVMFFHADDGCMPCDTWLMLDVDTHLNDASVPYLVRKLSDLVCAAVSPKNRCEEWRRSRNIPRNTLQGRHAGADDANMQLKNGPKK